MMLGEQADGLAESMKPGLSDLDIDEQESTSGRLQLWQEWGRENSI
jgi:hypothetical protein